VTGALPVALNALGVRTRSLMPGYPVVMSALKKKKALHQYRRCKAARQQSMLLRLPASTCWCSTRRICSTGRAAPMAMRPADWPDNWRRFAALGRCRRRHRCRH
jgi:starch synthase